MTETSKGSDAPKRSESDVYDRQIRLWGAEAQAKMAKSKVLYIHVTGLTSEVLKNLVLAGIRAVLCDNRLIEQVAQTPSFFLTKTDKESPATKKQKQTVADVLKPKVEELNPLLGDCEIVSTPVAELSKEFLSQFSIVIASRISMTDAIRISKATVESGGKFYLADSFGYNGASVFDLGADHKYRPEIAKKLLDPTNLKEHVPLEVVLRTPLSDAVNRFHKTPLPNWIHYRSILEYVEKTKAWPTEETAEEFVETVTAWVKATCPTLMDHEVLTKESLESLAKCANYETAPVCSVLGGILGNEVIKAISGKGEPANNTLLMDGMSCKAWTFLVKPKK